MFSSIDKTKWKLTNAARTGRKMVAVATLLVNSVKIQMTIVMIRMRTGAGTPWKTLNWSASHWERPDSYNIMIKGHSVRINRFLFTAN